MNWVIWLPVEAGFDTLMAVKKQWTIDDLMDAHEVLVIREEQRNAKEKK